MNFQHMPLHALVEQVVNRCPSAVAVQQPSGKTTFEQLWNKVVSLTRAILLTGAGRETVVAIALPPSADLLAAIIATSRSGAAFLLLDPEMASRQRTDFVLGHSGASLLLSYPETPIAGPSKLGRLNVSNLAASSSLGDGQTANGSRRTEPALGSVAEDDLAYVMYTSGSSGIPKGVEISSSSLTNYLAWAVDTYLSPGLGGAPVITSIAFDMALTSLLTPLLGGQPVVFPPVDADFDEVAMVLGAGAPFSFIKTTPTHFHILGAVLGPGAGQVATTLVVGGEQFQSGTLAAWRSGTTERVFNEYGPTEGTVASVTYDVNAAAAEAHGPTSIGRPIPGTDAYVLTPAGQRANAGQDGELYISGRCVARGYRSAPAATAARFVPDPFHPGARMYRTGDRARVDSQGVFTCLGRIDDQLNLRGYRVEPAEVEAVLGRCDGVSSCVVTVEGDDRSARLVAFITGPPGVIVDCLAVRQHLSGMLPDYMVPSVIRQVDQLAVSATGKLHR